MGKVNGISEMQAAARSFFAKLQVTAPKAALAGAELIAKEIEARAPVGATHELRDSVRVAQSRDDRGGVRAVVIVGGRAAPEAAWIEYGAPAHQIVPKKAHVLYFGGHFFAKVQHPGIAPMPFMRPAIQAKESEAINAVVSAMRESLKSV